MGLEFVRKCTMVQREKGMFIVLFVISCANSIVATTAITFIAVLIVVPR